MYQLRVEERKPVVCLIFFALFTSASDLFLFRITSQLVLDICCYERRRDVTTLPRVHHVRISAPEKQLFRRLLYRIKFRKWKDLFFIDGLDHCSSGRRLQIQDRCYLFFLKYKLGILNFVC